MEVPIGDFLRDMGRPLQYREPTIVNNLWVFWSQEEGEGEGGGVETLTNDNRDNVQECLKYALCNAEQTSWPKDALIQFWAPTTSTIGGRWVLKTSNQPFGLHRLDKRICEYRKLCTSLEYEYEFGGVISRVFRHKKPEYRLLGAFARNCGIWGSYFRPLFKPSSRCCSGVFEIAVTFHISLFDSGPCSLAQYIFKEAKFTSTPSLKLQQSTEIEEINKALQGVCTALQLPLAQIWIPCCTSTAVAYVDKPGEHCHSPYLSCSNKFSSSISQNGDPNSHYCKIKEFNSYCKGLEYRKGQSIVGKSLLYHKPCFCRDVTQLPEAEDHFSDFEEISEFGGCCAIWLHSTRTNHDYVLQFLFPPWNTFHRVLQTSLELLLATVKKQLPGFKISSVGEESCVEVYEISVNDDESDSVIITPHCFSVKPVPESFANEKEMVQDKVVGETVIDNGSNILGLEQNGIVVCHSEKTAGEELFVEAAMDDEITRRLPPMLESLRNENEVVLQLSDDERTVRKKELNGGIVKQTIAAVTSSERIFSRAEASEREYRTTNITLSREDLTKHFGKKLDDAAKILNVSRSTMKRALRDHKIVKWPVPKRKKVAGSGNEGIEGTYKGDPSCSVSPPTPAIAGIPHKISNSRQEHDVGNVTIKATHGSDTFRFKLPFLSRKADLVEKVKTRVSLNEGSFNIKYQDEENEWISIACDDDLGECIDIWKGKSKIIKMLVEPITNQAP